LRRGGGGWTVANVTLLLELWILALLVARSSAVIGAYLLPPDDLEPGDR
jgi:hypothetical protein